MSSVAPHENGYAGINGHPPTPPPSAPKPRLAERIRRAQMMLAAEAAAEKAAAEKEVPPAASVAAVAADLQVSAAEDVATDDGARPAEPLAESIVAEHRAIAAASRLVTLIAEQRSLLERLQEVTGPRKSPAPAPEAALAQPEPPDLAELETALASACREASPPPVALNGAALPPLTALPAPGLERPPMIIERAHQGFAMDGEQTGARPSPVPALAAGFAIALILGAILYFHRLAG